MFACLYIPDAPGLAAASPQATRRLVDVARACSPRVHARGEHVVTMDVDGLRRLFGNDRAVAEQVRRAAAEGGYPRAHVAVAATQTAAILLASMRPGLTAIEAGAEAAALAPLPLRTLAVLFPCSPGSSGPGGRAADPGKRAAGAAEGLSTLSRWGIRTLGQLAALPPVQIAERLGQDGVRWQRWARGEDAEPLVPAPEDEVFEATFDPEWPIEGTEPLSFVLGRLLDSLCQRLERRDRSAAVLRVRLRLVTREVHARDLQLPAPMRDPRVLRTLLMLALDAHPAPAGIDAVTIAVDPTPGRVVQESLLARALPPPEQVATLMARLSALMGERRCGSPRLVDSHRPGAFGMAPFRMDARQPATGNRLSALGSRSGTSQPRNQPTNEPRNQLTSQQPETGDQRPPNQPESSGCCLALRRFRLPVPARVLIDGGRPITVRTERQFLQGGRVLACAGPWRTSGEWWNAPASSPTELDALRGRAGWNRDEWDVALSDGGLYRVFEDRDSGRWFMDGMVD